ncbi:MAG TPA: hypothetical protein VEG60_21465 [Candidatus Binatia bacterium]|nr:hypothetical protein [Candidatus Binatia bacterium]
MTMTPRLRKFVFTAHITISVGWLGAVVAYLALAIAGLSSHDDQTVRAAYLSMKLIGWFVIVPFSLAALLTGLVQSLGTPWGLFRHYWILVKFVLTSVATFVLLRHMQAVSRMSDLAAQTIETTMSSADFGALRIQLVVHAAGALLVLLAVTTLSVYKPWGMTAYGRRKDHERRKLSQTELFSYPDPSVRPDQGSTTIAPRWVFVVGLHAIGLVLLFAILHLTGVAPRH